MLLASFRLWFCQCMQSFGIRMRKNSEDPVHAAISFSSASHRKNIWKCPKLHDWTAGPNVFISNCWKCFKTALFPTWRLNLLLTITTRWQACTFQCLKWTLPCRRLRKCLLALQMESEGGRRCRCAESFQNSQKTTPIFAAYGITQMSKLSIYLIQRWWRKGGLYPADNSSLSAKAASLKFPFFCYGCNR